MDDAELMAASCVCVGGLICAADTNNRSIPVYTGKKFKLVNVVEDDDCSFLLLLGYVMGATTRQFTRTNSLENY